MNANSINALGLALGSSTVTNWLSCVLIGIAGSEKGWIAGWIYGSWFWSCDLMWSVSRCESQEIVRKASSARRSVLVGQSVCSSPFIYKRSANDRNVHEGRLGNEDVEIPVYQWIRVSTRLEVVYNLRASYVIGQEEESAVCFEIDVLRG
jgi:hypothetical protein